MLETHQLWCIYHAEYPQTCGGIVRIWSCCCWSSQSSATLKNEVTSLLTEDQIFPSMEFFACWWHGFMADFIIGLQLWHSGKFFLHMPTTVQTVIPVAVFRMCCCSGSTLQSLSILEKYSAKKRKKEMQLGNSNWNKSDIGEASQGGHLCKKEQASLRVHLSMQWLQPFPSCLYSWTLINGHGSLHINDDESDLNAHCYAAVLVWIVMHVYCL